MDFKNYIYLILIRTFKIYLLYTFYIFLFVHCLTPLVSPDMSPSRRCIADRLGAGSKVLGAASCAPVTTLADSPLIVSPGMGRGGQLLHNLLFIKLLFCGPASTHAH